MKKYLLVIFVLLGHVFGEDNFEEFSIYKEAVEFVRSCGNQELYLCGKERVLRYIDSLPNNMDLGNGMKIKLSQPERIARRSPITSLPDELHAREEAVDNLLLEKLNDFIYSHTFEFHVPNQTINDLKKSVEEGRKRRRGGMRLRNMLMIIQLKAAAIGALILKTIGLVAFKALLLAKVALTISSIIALKKLVETNRHTSTYEVYPHAHFDEHSHFDRSFKQDLSYKGYKGGRSTN